MKTGKQNTIAAHARSHAIGRMSILVGALVAGGVLSPLAMPMAVAAPLPVPCAGCMNGAVAIPSFVTAGAVTLSSTGPTNMTVNQATPTAILNWQNFNIDKGYSVNFVQPSSTASALNRIWDANPTTIAGSLTANGQIYLINQNGIVFANGAQVNTGALIASSLDISDAIYQKGYLANNNSAGVITPAFVGTTGFVRVDTGAVINGSRVMMFAPVVENNGSIASADGQTVLAAGNKVYLEASQDPNLRGVLVEVDVTTPGAVDAKLTGLVANNAAGTVTNTADILAQRGNITLIGFAVNQQGRVSATTSVSQNGSIKLLARYNVAAGTAVTNNNSQMAAGNAYAYDIRATQTGTVTLAKNSMTQVAVESTDTATTTDGQGFNRSIVEVMGKTINMQGSIVAPSGKVNLVAVGAIDPTVGVVGQSGMGIYQEIDKALAYSSFLNPNYMPVASATSGARVFLDNGSLIDVSGSTASVSVARNILNVQLRGSQLADAPLQKNGYLWGQTVQIDIRKGSTLANYAGDEAAIARGVLERTATGGSVVIASTGDAIMNPGAVIDISGGKINYTGANINTSSLLSNGVAYDVANAPNSIIYNGISGSYSVNHAKWGITETFSTMAGGDTRGRYDAGYFEGKAAGSVTMLVPTAAIEGKIIANTVSGIYQRQQFVDLTASGTVTPAYASTYQMKAKGGSLVIGYAGAVADAVTGQINFVTNSDVVVGANAAATNYLLGDAALATTTPITLGAGLFAANAGSLNNVGIYTNGIASIAAGTSFAPAAGGSLTLQGGQVDMLGTISSSGGSVNLKSVVTTNPLFGKVAGAVTVSGNISTRGTWVNDSSYFGALDTSKAIVNNGGNISFNSGNTLNIASGLTFDASAGGWVDQTGKIKGGTGGNISISGGSIQAALDKITFSSYGVDTGKGGSLKLGAGDVQIGGVASVGTQFLSNSFFQTGGFSSYTITSLGALGLTVDGLIQPKAQSLILNRDAVFQATGTDVYALSSRGFLPDWQRNPTSITLEQKTATGALTINANAQLQVDAKSSITLNAANQLTVLGSLIAPAGNINLNLQTIDTAAAYRPMQSIWLGGQSKLLSQGYFMAAAPNAQNLTQGQVLAGGKINITTNTGYVVAQQGSLMDVSGTAANIDLPQLQSGNLVYATAHVAGDAGSISVQSGEGAVFDGTMKAGVEAGSQAAAGSFSLTLNNNPGVVQGTGTAIIFNPLYPLNPAQIQLMAGGSGTFAGLAGVTATSVAGATALDLLAGKAMVDATALQQAGFDQVKLKSDNSILLANQVNLQTKRSVSLDSQEFVVNGSSSIASAQVTLGNLSTVNQPAVPQSFISTANLLGGGAAGSITSGNGNVAGVPQVTVKSPTAGLGILSVSGQQVDLTGNFLLSGVSQFNATSTGDLRLNGVVNAAQTGVTGSLRTLGNVTLQADQVYTSTLAQFNVSVENALANPAGRITVLPGLHAPHAVMSAGSQLTLSAMDIVQNGVLKAPTGTLNLNGTTSVTLGAGSVTSVSGEGVTTPFGVIQGGNTWMYDVTGVGNYITVAAPPAKIMKLTAPNVAVAKGATVDLSGGGDLYANEFFAGTGGSVNVLDPTKAPANTFAIVPGMSGFAPYDAQALGQYAQSTSKTTLQPGSSVYLAGGNGLAAGYYTLLPANYALLPGAYRVTAVAGYADRQPGQGVTTLLDGSQVMAGKFAVVGTNIQDARWSGFAVASGALVRTQAEFHDSLASTFFAAQAASAGSLAPRTPFDAGQLIVNAGTTLQLAGSFNSQHSAASKGAWIDLSGPGFDIVNTAGTGAAGLVELTSASLNSLGAESLLIGGVRTATASGTSIAVGAATVNVNNAGATLTGAEIMLAANAAVTVKAGSNIQGTGAYSSNVQNITIDNRTPANLTASGDGALLRVSSGAQVTVARTNSLGTAGTLTVENGATLGAQNSVLLDASFATNIGASSILTGKALSVAANTIDVGAGSSGVNALGLSSGLLGQMQGFQDLTLHSYNDINFYGAAALGGLGATGNHLINNLVLNARSINGVNNAGNIDSIDAASVTLMNNNGAVLSAVPNGSGTLKVSADQIVLADGSKAVRGFDSVALNAAQQILGQGTGGLTASSTSLNAHSLVLQGTMTGAAKSNQTILATGYDATILAPTAVAPTNSEVGAKLAITAKSILDSGSINLAAGVLSLHATGLAATDGVVLDSTSKTSAAGLMKNIAGQAAYASAGSIALQSDSGNLDIRSGALVDVSGAAGGGDAGTLSMTASKGVATVAGSLKGSALAGNVQGSYLVDVASLGGTGNSLTGLNDALTAGGFSNLRDIRVRTGNLTVDADVLATAARAKAQTFRLAADDATAGNGNIIVNGMIDSSGVSGGNIVLAAKNNLTLNAGALLDAHATGATQNGGKVLLATTAGVIDLGNQRIDVHGAGNTGGSVNLRAPQIATLGSLTNNDVALNNTGGTKLNISTGANVTVEAFKSYTSATGTLAAADVATTSVYYTDATAFAANATTIKTRLGMLADPTLHLTPGVEINSATNLTLTSDWDLSKWRFNDGNGGVTEAGVLTLKAVGDLNFGTVNPTTTTATDNTASISDGFGSTTTFDVLAPGSANWSYRLVAGSDVGAANALAVNNAATGNVNLVRGGFTPGIPAVYNARKQLVAGTGTPSKTSFEMIRTGTGTIDVAAGNGLYLGNTSAMIYTAGQQSVGLPASLGVVATKAFATGGGDINIAVKGDISAVGQAGTGEAVSQLVSDWLYRQGSTTLTNGTYATLPAWWVNYGSFAQNIGALGGGNLNISAGGNITSLSAVVPSSGYVAAPGAAATLLTNGNLNVQAGGDINSGIFYVGNGQGTIRAGGALGSSRMDTTGSTNAANFVNLYTVLALGQGSFDVRTGGDLNLQTVLNPTMLGLSPLFFTYNDTSSVALSSMNGNVLLSNATNFYVPTTTYNTLLQGIKARTAPGNNIANSPYINSGLVAAGALTVYPGTLSVTAMNGGITSNLTSSNVMNLYPTAKGNLQFVAATDIAFNGTLTLPDINNSTLQANTPMSAYSDQMWTGHGTATGTQLPTHSGDTAPVVIAAGGSITGDNSSPVTPSLTFSKSANIQAGVDIKNLSMSVQNAQSTDTTSMTAGRDIVFSPMVSTPAATTLGVTLAGSGQLVVQAGRNVDLGQSAGLITSGNLSNPYLPEQGASISVLAGVGQNTMASQAFIDKYINPTISQTYNADLLAYAGNYGLAPNSTVAQAYTTFSGLAQPLKDAFVKQVFFSELRTTGRAAVNTGKYQPGYDVIATLFPLGGGKGDVNLYYSQIKTVRGGDISILTPGGGVNAGLANPSASGPKKTAAELGIVTVKGGNVSAYVNNDFLVNQSRVFTLQGGDILMWSSYGNLDAGKGSKTVSSTPPPLLMVDPKTGTFNVDVTQSVVGSGIRVLLASKNVIPGSVDLYAPTGQINAGDAGIGAAGNIYLGAPHIVGADNINFGGVAAGVPVAAPAPVSVGLASMQDASKAAEQATQSLATMKEMVNMKDFKPTFLSVEVIGLGE